MSAPNLSQRPPGTDRPPHSDPSSDPSADPASGFRVRRASRGANGWVGFVARHGWRAYALPVLVVCTVIALFTALGSRSGHSAAGSLEVPRSTGVVATPRASTAPHGTDGPVSPTTTTTTAATPKTAPTTAASPAPAATNAVSAERTGGGEELAADALPPGASFVSSGTRTFTTLAGSSKAWGSGKRFTFDLEVEGGLGNVDTSAFVKAVMATLSDEHSWAGPQGAVSLQRVSTAGAADFHVTLSSPMTLRKPCDYEQHIETSCWSAPDHRVYLNLARWVRGDTQFGQDLTMYRRYMINHEVGHALGHQHTYTCLPNGLAPVMMQQTITLRENQGQGKAICQPNVWPYPAGVAPSVAVPT